MRNALVIIGALSLASLCNAANINSCISGPVPVTANLAITCYRDIFDFGHDLQHNAANPLPIGGSIILKSMAYQVMNDSYPEWDLDFGFTTPSARTTELDFTVFGISSPVFNSGISFFALGRSPSPFNTQPPNDANNTPNETGSNFLITETLTDIYGNQGQLSVCGGNAFSPCDGSIVNQNGDFEAFSARVQTVISDKAGDLTGFDEGFQTPEPATWALALGGMLGLWTIRRSKSR